MRTSKLGGARRLGLVAAGIASLVALTVGAPVAQAAPSSAATGAVVVFPVSRPPIGEMLSNKKGLSLYTHPSGPCTGSCLSVWPALLMPKGTTKPKGASCLATVPFAGGRLQVTYHSQPLYTFVNDSGSSVNGNGIAGFKAAKVKSSCP